MQRKMLIAIPVTAAGILFGLAVAFGFIPTSEETKIREALGLAITMAWFWLLPATWHYCHFALVALLPLFFLSWFPGGFVGVQTMTLGGFAHPLLALFVLALLMGAVVKANEGSMLLQRVILWTRCGSIGVLVILVVFTAVISAFMPNTAAAAIVLPVVVATARLFRNQFVENPMRIAVAFAATLGGLATVIGTMPNGITQQALARQGIHVDFWGWAVVGVPVAIACLGIMVPIVLWVSSYPRLPAPCVLGEEHVDKKAIGRLLVAAFLFATIIASWIVYFEKSKPHQPFFWLWVLAFFAIVLIPVRGRAMLPVARIAHWKFVKSEVSLFILLGGGMALGTVLQTAKADAFAAQYIFGWCNEDHPYRNLLFLGIIFAFLGEPLSNTSFASLIMPLVLASAAAFGVHPLVLGIAMGMCCSHGYMLPTATPPNAVMAEGLSREEMDTYQSLMRRSGFILDIVLPVVTVTIIWLLA